MANILDAKKEMSDVDMFFESAPNLKDESLIKENVKTFINYVG
jgi:hypothetical protein